MTHEPPFGFFRGTEWTPRRLDWRSPGFPCSDSCQTTKLCGPYPPWGREPAESRVDLVLPGKLDPTDLPSLLPAARWAPTGWAVLDLGLAAAARGLWSPHSGTSQIVRSVGRERCPRLRAVVASWVEDYPDSFPKRSQRKGSAGDWEVYGVLVDACADARLVDELPTLASRAPSQPETWEPAEPPVFEQLVAESLASTEAARVATNLIARRSSASPHCRDAGIHPPRFPRQGWMRSDRSRFPPFARCASWSAGSMDRRSTGSQPPPTRSVTTAQP